MSSTTTAATTAPTTAATTAPTTAATTATTITETTTGTLSPNFATGGIILIIFIIIFIIVSIYCLVKSLMCFGKSGSTAEKVIGVLIAFFTGPFYLLYLNFNTGYCEDEEAMPPAMPSSQQMGGRRRK